ncbi:hypothetical protein [Vreelandella titanicae]|uniref:hypothetical protein n=1 Tax=Vreelandella titanicae TaxID=664683 RepID=UPI001CC22AB6|nr:hypothetical protein [Halomonas titanicae]
MITLRKIVSLVLVLIPLTSWAQVPEIADPNLNDIAMVQPHPQYEAVIIYNPIICQQIGAACGFFRAHEHGHITLGHQFMHPGAYPAQREAQADEWAAANAHPHEILAAYNLFKNGWSSIKWWIYGHPVHRAARLRQYAINYGRWVGP